MIYNGIQIGTTHIKRKIMQLVSLSLLQFVPELETHSRMLNKNEIPFISIPGDNCNI